MIVLVTPRATKPRNRRFPLSVMSLGAVLPEGQSWAIVDGNLPGVDVADEVAALIDAHARTADPVSLVAMTVMPGPQLLLADEPTGNLDPVNKQRIIQILFDRASHAQTTLIMVTHDYNLLEGFDQIIDFQDFQKEG